MMTRINIMLKKRSVFKNDERKRRKKKKENV